MKTQELLKNWNGLISPEENQVHSFRKVDEPLGWLSNMSSHPLRVETIWYPTCEHFFQCMRFGDEEIRNEIRKQKSPMSSKMISKRFKDRMVIIPRGEGDLDLMRTVLRIKMEFYPKLRNELILQDPGSVIIEDCSKRGGESSRFWGMKLNGTVCEGENWLGRLWMEFRSELQGCPVVDPLDTTRFPGSMWIELHNTLYRRVA